ncbi:MAG TPA: AraC family transcriptional regulator [Pyrinomonadaceae bacterium]
MSSCHLPAVRQRGEPLQKLGAELLKSTDNSVAEIAVEVGYGSEATFNRAFKREFDCPPAQYRRKQRQKPSTDYADYTD